MTGSTSVGIGLMAPLGMSSLAKEYSDKFGTRAGTLAFPDFVRARKLSAENVAELRALLKSQYHIEPVATRVESTLSDLDHFFADFAVKFFTKVITRAPKTLKKSKAPRSTKGRATPISSTGAGFKGGQLKTPSTATTSTGLSARQTITPKKPSKLTTAQGKLIREGLGFSPDADGRGGGVGGGSPLSASPDYNIEPETVTYKKDPKRELEKKAAQEVAKRLSKSNPTPYETEIGGSNGVGSKTQMGYVRVPGGPVSVSEQGCISFKCLTPDSVEISAGGASTVHDRPLLAQAVKHRLSSYGRTFNDRMPKILEWLWHRSKTGESLVIDPSENTAYVMNEGGYKSEAF